MTDPWMVYEQEWIGELEQWPKPFLHKVIDFWMRVDSSVVELFRKDQISE